MIPLLLAQTPVAPAIGPTWWQNLLAEAAAILIPLLGAALLALLVAGVRWVAISAKDSRFAHAVNVATEAAEGAAQKVKTELLPALTKAMAADSDGGIAITPAERAQLIAQGVSILKSTIGPGILKALGAVFGTGLDAWLGSKVEAAIVGQAIEVLPKQSP